MRWKQFFTPAESLTAEQAQKFLAETPFEDVILLDVRQPREYRAGHLPGAKLIPLPELHTRLGELSPEKITLVY
jgi:rhodanese-related sulfurtransferase